MQDSFDLANFEENFKNRKNEELFRLMHCVRRQSKSTGNLMTISFKISEFEIAGPTEIADPTVYGQDSIH